MQTSQGVASSSPVTESQGHNASRIPPAVNPLTQPPPPPPPPPFLRQSPRLSSPLSSFFEFFHHPPLLDRPTVFGCLYSLLTIGSLCLSVRPHESLAVWLQSNGWSLFLLWHLEVHFLYGVYFLLNFLFLGKLRSFEKQKVVKIQFKHMLNSVLFVVMACGFDMAEGLTWLHWSAPFTFIRMSICLATERFENPCRHSFPCQPNLAASRDRKKGYFFKGVQGWLFGGSGDKDEGNDDTSCLLMYLLIIAIEVIVCCRIGKALLAAPGRWSNWTLMFEPLFCGIQWVILFCHICLSRRVGGCEGNYHLSRCDLSFFLSWVGNMVSFVLIVIRYTSLWLMYGHSLMFNVGDILIFMKLKGAFIGIASSCRHIHGYLSVLSILSNKVANVTFHITEGKKEGRDGESKMMTSPNTTTTTTDATAANLSDKLSPRQEESGRSGDIYVEEVPSCVICREGMYHAKMLRCGHCLHRSCLRQWLESEASCPVCRAACLEPGDERLIQNLFNLQHPTDTFTPQPETPDLQQAINNTITNQGILT